jgi:hypothetical protein
LSRLIAASPYQTDSSTVRKPLKSLTLVCG